jgi:hypothetical protein
MRGRNPTKGGVHHSIHAAFPDSCISAHHGENLLSIFQLNHNITVGTRNSTGKEYDGHFDMADLNLISSRIRIPETSFIGAYIEPFIHPLISNECGTLSLILSANI